MKFISAFHDLNGNRIHYIDSHPKSDPSKPPILICPGLSETAEEYIGFLEDLLPRRGIALSFRGRGKSDSPIMGYDLDDHIIDIVGIVKHLSLENYHLFAHSRGVPYALGYAYKYSNKLKSIILQDYPPMHKQMPNGWAENYINNYLIPHQRSAYISEVAVRGIQRDSKQIEFIDTFNKPGLILRGLLKGTLINEEDILKYQKLIGYCEIIEFTESRHDIRNTERDKHLRVIQAFLDKIEN